MNDGFGLTSFFLSFLKLSHEYGAKKRTKRLAFGFCGAFVGVKFNK